MNQWRPIESAPKDGTHIDLWMVDESGYGHRVPDAYWNAEGRDVYFHDRGKAPQPCWWAKRFGYDGDDGCCETKRYVSFGREIFDEPTHWMPIPEGPK